MKYKRGFVNFVVSGKVMLQSEVSNIRYIHGAFIGECPEKNPTCSHFLPLFLASCILGPTPPVPDTDSIYKVAQQEVNRPLVSPNEVCEVTPSSVIGPLQFILFIVFLHKTLKHDATGQKQAEKHKLSANINYQINSDIGSYFFWFCMMHHRPAQ